MQRRDFARSLLFGAGAACTLAASASPIAAAAGWGDLHGLLARAQPDEEPVRWTGIDACAAPVCTTPRLRIEIESIDFAATTQPFVIDALLDTHAGLRPFRIATFQPGSLSASSKPFSFEVGRGGLAGFRGELGRAGEGPLSIAGVATRAGAHAALAPGRYLLAFAASGRQLAELAASTREDAGRPLRAQGARLIFAVREAAA